MTTLLAILCLACQAPPDWSGTYDCCNYVVVIVATPQGYETQWYGAKGKLWYYGVVQRNARGEWVEMYPPELSPDPCDPWRWHVERGMLIGATDHPTWRFKKR